MKRTFKTLFCVLTICAMVACYGCGDKADDAGGAKKGADTSESADSGSEDK